MRKKKLFWQLYVSNFLVILLALFAFSLLTSFSFKNILLDQVSEDLIARAAIMRNDVLRVWRQGDIASLRRHCSVLGRESQTRITLIRADGLVLVDTWHDPGTMDNHRNRPEVRPALEGRRATFTRYSNTIEMNTMYAAIPLREGERVTGVLRTAVLLETVEDSIAGLQLQIVLGGFVIALFAGVMSYLISRRIRRPIDALKQGARRFADGDLDFRMPVPNSEELSDLAVVMNTMAAQLQQRLLQITQQHSEQDAVLSSMLEGVIAFDMDERLINVNRSGARLLRIDLEKARGKTIQEVVRNIGLQRFVEDTLASGEAREGYITLVDDVERFLQVHGSILRDAQREPIGVVVVMNDYTALRNLENVRREFVANVSHELKTPITSIKGFVETLLDGAINDREDAVRFLGIVSRQADRLNAIIEDLLSLSRIEQGSEQEQIELTTGSVFDVLQSAMQACQVEAEAKGIGLRIDCAMELRAVMNAPLLEQAVVNLINNAIKYSDTGLSVRISGEAIDGGQVGIAVRDEGYGIEPEHLPRLFERFYRIDKARSRTMGGTGLGLAIVKHIVQAHHGSIDVQSVPGKGSTFSIVLPGIAGHTATDVPSWDAVAGTDPREE
ncbi:MAG: HAMP domain-containing protein [Bacteroidetes bacterium]|nr:HAMP domain-containing protein [Bacteroidota bacterium]